MDEAEQRFRQSVAVNLRHNGPKERDVVIAKGRLAGLLRTKVAVCFSFVLRRLDRSQTIQQGKLDEAQKLLEEVVAISKEVYAQDHPDISAALNNLARVYVDKVIFLLLQTVVSSTYHKFKKGDYEKAIELQRESARITKKLLGSQSPEYATDLNNLAQMFHAQVRANQFTECTS